MKNKTILKTISALLIVTLLVCQFSVVLAAGALSANTIYSTKTSVTAGKTVDIPIYISENSGFAGFGILITYDPNILTPVEVTDTDGIVSGGTQNSIGGNLLGLPENTVKIMYSGFSNITDNGQLFIISFDVNFEATGSTTLQITYDQYDTIDENIEDVVFSCQNVDLTITNSGLDTLSKASLLATDATAGQNMTVNATLTDKKDLTQTTVKLAYDNTTYRYLSADSNCTISGITASDGYISFTLSDINILSNGDICFTVTFKISDTANAGKYTFSAQSEDMFFTDATANVYSSATSDSAIISSNTDLTGYYGETVAVPVFISNNKGLMGYKLQFEYDPTVLQPQTVANSYLFAGSSFYDNIGVHNNYFNVMWNHTSQVTNNGQLFYIEFLVLSQDAATTQITVTYSQADTYNEAYEDVTMICNNINISLNPQVAATTIDNFEYSIDGTELTILSYIGTATDVIIGSSYVIDGETYTVVAIEESAFETNEDITSVYIPETVTSIGAYAFYDCTSLTQVTIKNPNTVIGDQSLGWYYISRKEEGIVDGFTIYGLPGSTAEEYAATDDGITFVADLPDLKMSGASLKLENTIAINFYVKKDVIDGVYTSPKLEITFCDTVTEITTYTEKDQYYVFSFKNIPPHKMRETATAILYASYDGVQYSGTAIDYSIAQYCYTMLQKNSDDQYAKLRTLLVDILHYGAAAQNYAGYGAEDLANAALTEEQLAWGAQGDPTLESHLNQQYTAIENPTIDWKAANLNLNSDITINVYFTAPSVENLIVKVTDTSDTLLAEIASSSFEIVGERYMISFNGIHAGQMSQKILFTVYDGDNAVSDTVCYSVESYAYAKQNSTVPGLANLVKAMMNYGNAAYTYSQE